MELWSELDTNLKTSYPHLKILKNVFSHGLDHHVHVAAVQGVPVFPLTKMTLYKQYAILVSLYHSHRTKLPV